MKRFGQLLSAFVLGMVFVTSSVVPVSVISPIRNATSCLSPVLKAERAIDYRLRAEELSKLPFIPETENGKMLNPDYISNQMLMLIQLSEHPETLVELIKIKIDECRNEGDKIAIAPDKTLTQEQKKLVEEIELLYAPLAERVGLGSLAESLNDLSFRLAFYEEWQQTSAQFTDTFGISYRVMARKLVLEAKKIEEICQKLGIKAEVTYRQKKLYSIAEKIHRVSASKYNSIESLNDIFGVRLVIEQMPNEEEDFMLELISELQAALPVSLILDQLDRRTISKHGYNGWHIGLDYTNEFPSMEIQIMERASLQSYFEGVPREGAGISAHWAYKIWKKTDGRETFRYIPGLNMAGKSYNDSFYDLKAAADRLGTFVFVRKKYGSIDNIALLPGATAADAARQIGMLSARFRSLVVSDWKNPHNVRTVRYDRKLKSGDIILGVETKQKRLSLDKLYSLFFVVEHPATKYFLFKELRKIEGEWDEARERALILEGSDILDAYNIVINEENRPVIKKIAKDLGFNNLYELLQAVAVEEELDENSLLKILVRKIAQEGMNILVTHYNINPIDNRIDEFIPFFISHLGKDIAINKRDAFFFALALGQVETGLLELAFATIESPLLSVREIEREVILTVAA